MIGELEAGKSGYFYKLTRPLSAHAITELFRDVRAAHKAPSNNHFHHVREPLGNALWSAVCFMFERKPAFLGAPTPLLERVCGFLMLVEYQGHLTVFKSQLDVPATFVSRHLNRVTPEAVDASVTAVGSVFEKLRLRNMTLSRYALRAKTLEGEDLANSVPASSSGRFAPLGYGVRTNGDYFTATTRTGRVSLRSDKVGHTDLVAYATRIIDGLIQTPGTGFTLLNQFARPLDLASVTSRPTLFAIDVARLQGALFDEEEIRFVELINGQWTVLPKPRVDEVLASLGEPFNLTGTAPKMSLEEGSTRQTVGAISLNKNRIALKALTFPQISGIKVEVTLGPRGMDDQPISLKEFLDRQDAFIVLFDDAQLAYIDGALYRDESMTNGGTSLLDHLFTESALSSVKSEKGNFLAGQTHFEAESTFGVLVNSVASGDNVLVCDDLGDEWADFIGLKTDLSPPRVTFYHAKHGTDSLGASPFHISVSQAIKNLGRLGLQRSEVQRKFARWRGHYANNLVQTSISCVCIGDLNSLEAEFELCCKAPYTQKRVAIVTSSLSKASVEITLQDIQRGIAPKPHFVQLYWLLMSFFAACTEVGAFGLVICKS